MALEPGQIVQHPEYGYGVVAKMATGSIRISYTNDSDYPDMTYNLTGWEPVKIVKPGHNIYVLNITEN